MWGATIKIVVSAAMVVAWAGVEHAGRWSVVRLAHEPGSSHGAVPVESQTENKTKDGQKEKSTEPAFRQAKNARYNGGPCDLTALAPDVVCVDQVWPRGISAIPTKESDVIVLGEVTSLQPYLSADHTRIYTEIAVRVEQGFKVPLGLEPQGSNTIVIDVLGGVLRMPSGQIIRDRIKVEFLGRPYVGGRYVLFGKSIHRGKDVTLLRGYELRDGHVFKLRNDGGPGNEPVSSGAGNASISSEEEKFVQLIRNGLTKSR